MIGGDGINDESNKTAPPPIRTVTGDGGRWITDCADRSTQGCKGCADLFHVIE